MEKIVFDVETCSEKYKEHIRNKKYGDIIQKTTKESMVFIYGGAKYTVKFTLEFSYDFENAFNYTYFSEFKCSRKVSPNVMEEFEKYIMDRFITNDRMSA